jgi:hypothetical protein
MLKAEHSTAEPASMTSSGAPQVESVKSEDNWRTRLAKQFRTASPDKGEAVVEDILGGGHSRSRSSSPLKVRLDEIFFRFLSFIPSRSLPLPRLLSHCFA